MQRDYDLELIANAFLLGALEDQRDLVRRMALPINDSTAIRIMIDEIAHEADRNKALPSQIMALGLNYGMVLGIFIERERAARKEHNFDVSGVTLAFTSGQYAERAKLFREFTRAFTDLPIMKRVLIAVGTEALHFRNSPQQVIALTLRYGIVMGITLEKDRVARAKVLVQ